MNKKIFMQGIEKIKFHDFTKPENDIDLRDIYEQVKEKSILKKVITKDGITETIWERICRKIEKPLKNFMYSGEEFTYKKYVLSETCRYLNSIRKKD